MGAALADTLSLIIRSLGSLLLLAVLLRFLLQAVRADFYNPVSQAIVKITAPLLMPFRRVIPGFRGIDFASLVLALVLNSVFTALLILVAGFNLPSIGIVVAWAFVGLLAFLLKIYFWSLIISIIASFVAPFSGNPALLVVYQILEPLYSRIRRIIPPMGGLDLSPIFIFLAINVVEIMVVGTLARGLRLNPGYVIGL
ncbi:MAG TPA: YggT family protein [Pseudomonadales bacterium]